ncbi:hypothetical protein LINPERHAP1_LOCUS21870 [Linum perenne]
MVVWVRLPHLPIVFYHPQILTALGNLIGKIVRIDFPTQNANRGKFARLDVEINLEEPLALVILLDGAQQMVEYENISLLCFDCEEIGHDTGLCPRKTIPDIQSVENKERSSVIQQGSVVAAATSEVATDEFGPWMVVSRKYRRQRREVTPNKESSQLGKMTGGKEQLGEVLSNGGKSGGKNKGELMQQDLGANNSSSPSAASTPHRSGLTANLSLILWSRLAVRHMAREWVGLLKMLVLWVKVMIWLMATNGWD